MAGRIQLGRLKPVPESAGLAAGAVGAWQAHVGLPQALGAAAGVAAAAGGITVELHDERFTTREAQQALRAGGKRAREQRDHIDAAAAAVMLQSWIDTGRAREAQR